MGNNLHISPETAAFKLWVRQSPHMKFVNRSQRRKHKLTCNYYTPIFTWTNSSSFAPLQ